MGKQGVYLQLSDYSCQRRALFLVLKQHFRQQGKTALVVSPGGDGAVGSLDNKVDMLILKFSQAPLPDVMKLHISLRRQGYVNPTVMVCDYGVDEQSAGTGLMTTPVSVLPVSAIHDKKTLAGFTTNV